MSRSRPHLGDIEPEQLTLDGRAVGHRQVVAEQERLEREERERALRRRREEEAAKRPQPMAPEIMTPLFDVE